MLLKKKFVHNFIMKKKNKNKNKKIVGFKTCLSLTGYMTNFRVISTLNSISGIFSLKES